jgi:serine/threonine protein kinase/DNA-binding response OmpR family regulator
MPTSQERHAVTRSELVQNLRDSRLLSEDELTHFFSSAGSARDGQALAEGLQAAGLVTAFQLDAILQRRFDELRIGNYEVLDRLGAGGMGTVYKARHRRMKRIVALKVMMRSLSDDATKVQRFQREVETIARLSHPNIVLAFDADEAEAGHFLVMEFVNGRDLATLVQEGGPFLLRDAVSCTLQAARGLEYAHGQNIIHRDIKPANLLRDEHGTVKITDLGLARLNDTSGSAVNNAVTQEGGIVGTVDFMPPEQAFDTSAVDHRSDIYSLGCTLYYLLAGASPFGGSSAMAVLLKHREAPIPSLAVLRPETPPALDAAFRKMLAKNPAERFQSMTELVAALESIPLPQEEKPRVTVVGVPGTPTSLLTPGQPQTTSELAPISAANTDYRGEQTVALTPGSVETVAQLSVLLVEPSRTQAAIIREYLKNLGITPLATVASGAEALQLVRNVRPDAIIATMYLKDMTGVQLAQQLPGGPTSSIGFVLISTEEESQTAGAFDQSGRATILHKPFDFDKLMKALSTVTGRTLKPVAERAGLSDSKSLFAGTSRAAMEPHVAQPRVRPDLTTVKVLLVDDSAPARLHQRGILKGLGLVLFEEAADGAQAVNVLAREKFDLIVTDYNMPYMDGAGLVGYLRQNPATAKVPIIMVTTEQDPAKLDAIRRLGVTVCDKSFNPAVVRPILDQFFG